MRTIFPLAVVLLLIAGLAPFGTVQETPPTGRVLLLRTERTLEGEITKVGTQYRIRSGRGESWIAGDQVARLFADWDEAHRYMQSRANLGDPDERLRLARWCMLNRLSKQALQEARVALEMRPTHGETTQLVALLERSLAGPNDDKTTARTPNAAPAMPSVDVSPETMIAFTTRVQPILMNACVGCHSGGRGGAFQLTRVLDGGQRAGTQRNLAVTLAHANLDQPALSPLLIKAVSAHGGTTRRPLENRQATPYRTLLTWLETTAAGNPHLVAQKPAPPKLAPTVAATATPLPMAPPPAPVEPRSEVAPPANIIRAVATEAPMAEPPSDPFDPAEFNRQNGPKQ